MIKVFREKFTGNHRIKTFLFLTVIGFLAMIFTIKVSNHILPERIVLSSVKQKSDVNIKLPMKQKSTVNSELHMKQKSTVNSELPMKQKSAVNIELTIRMPATQKMVRRVMCDLLRSAVLFWNKDYGKIHFILDETDINSTYFPNGLNFSGLPYSFRFTYEKAPVDKSAMTEIGRKVGRPYGYMLQLYSSFLMDLYTDAEIIAWTDTDSLFTQPVLKDSIIRNGKLVAKGMNTFKLISWVKDWDSTTLKALGLPMSSDFMTYFPAYVYPTTIKHCREFIMKRFNVTNFEEVFYMLDWVSPVSIIMSYAYYFERDLYEWHIDIGGDTLIDYNKNRLPNHPLTENDLLPELHVGIHSTFYQSPIPPIHQALCYVQINLALNVSESCKYFVNKPNHQLFEFSLKPIISHLKSWCRGNKRSSCDNMIQKQYDKIKELYAKKLITFNTTLVTKVEEMAHHEYGIKCPNIDLVTL